MLSFVALPHPGTLVLVHSSKYRGWVGRIPCYTTSCVWIQFLETKDEEWIDTEGIIHQTNFYWLKAHHVCQTPYPELCKSPHSPQGRGHHPLCHAIIDLVIAHASASGYTRIELTAILLAVNNHLARQQPPTEDSSSYIYKPNSGIWTLSGQFCHGISLFMT